MARSELKTIKELHEKIKSGEIDESKLVIWLDNDMTSFYVEGEEIKVKETNGYMDIEKLYPLLFPKSQVEWV